MRHEIGFMFVNQAVVPDIERTTEQLRDLLRKYNAFEEGCPITIEERALLANVEFFLSGVFRTHMRLQEDVLKALKLLDKAGVWTGADDLVSDRVDALIRGIVHGLR